MSSIDAKKVQVAVLGGVLGALAVGSAAWACTFQPRFVSLTDQSGPRGSTVTVTGEGAVPDGAVELRWNGVKGLQLASVTADKDGSFTALATIPDVAPDVYSLVVVASDSVSRAAFEVTADGPVSVASASPLATNAWSTPDRPSSFATPSLTDPAPSSSSTNFAAGAALLGVGMVALASGAGVAAVRRRSESTTNGR